jgi:hypothetical protein
MKSRNDSRLIWPATVAAAQFLPFLLVRSTHRLPSFQTRHGSKPGAERLLIVVNANRKVFYHCLAFAWCITFAEPGVRAETTGDSTRPSSVRCAQRSQYAIKREHERRLLDSLRRITGIESLEFASDGSLNLGVCSAARGGSAEARRILTRAVSSDTPFIIEDYSGSSSVNFGQAEREQIYEPRSGKRSNVWRLRLDFDDFREMNAPSEVRAAFDEGLTLLHELLHGLGYEDAFRPWELGECEEMVNQVRGELGLPVRDQYYGERWRVTERLTSVRLRFRSPRENKAKWQYLSFLVDGEDVYSRLGSVR